METRIINVFCPHRYYEDFENLSMKKLKAFAELTEDQLFYFIEKEYLQEMKLLPNSDPPPPFIIDDFQCIKCFKKTILGRNYEMEVALDDCYCCGMLADDFRIFCCRCAKRILYEFFQLVITDITPDRDELVYQFEPPNSEKLIQKRFHFDHLYKRFSIAKQVEPNGFFHDVEAFFQPIPEQET